MRRSSILLKQPQDHVSPASISTSKSSSVVKDTRTVREIFKERMAELKKKSMQGMVLSDQLDYRDPQNCSEFS